MASAYLGFHKVAAICRRRSRRCTPVTVGCIAVGTCAGLLDRTAVAVGFSLAITLPRAGNLGGGGFMLVYLQAEQKTIAVDFRSSAPQDILQDDFLFLKNNYDQRRYGYKASGCSCENFSIKP